MARQLADDAMQWIPTVYTAMEGAEAPEAQPLEAA